jgi:hypothetical protein
MDSTLSDTRPTFSRLTESKSGKSWRSALPAVIILVAFIALVGYLASKLSSYSQRTSVAERDANQYRDQLAGMNKQVGNLQNELSLARSPGRTTVILQSAQPAKAKKGAQPSPTSAWAAVTWGELPDGKSWMRVNAYGLSHGETGKGYHVWMQPQGGAPVDVGAVDVDANGDGFAMKSDLPGIDQGKAVMLTVDADNAKQPGDVVARADLPKLQPTTTPGQGPQNEAKPGAGSQPMHQAPGK